MKKLAGLAIGHVLLITLLFGLVLDTQSVSTKPEAKVPSDTPRQKVIDTLNEANQNQYSKSKDTITTQAESHRKNEGSNEPTNTEEIAVDISPCQTDGNGWVCPPDGAIYLGGEPPYAYIPTFTGKELPGNPIIPT